MSPMPAARLPAPSHPSPAGRPSPAQRWRALLLALLLPVLAALLLGRALPARAAGTVGSGTPGSCTYSALVAAAAGGGLVQFNCGFLPKTIVVTQTGGLLAPNNLTLDGGGRIILSGADSNRLLTVLAGRAVTLTHIVLAHGFQPGGA